MNIKQFEDYLRKQVLAERKSYLESRELSILSKEDQAIKLFKESNTLDEGFMDGVFDFLGLNKNTKKFLAEKYLSYVGVPASSKLYAPFMGYFELIEKEQLQKLFNGEEKARKHFTEFATLLALKTLRDDFTNIFGLTEETYIGGALLDVVQSIVGSDSFKETVKESIYDSLLNVSKDNFSDVDKKLDVDGDGLSAAEEEVIGSDDNEPYDADSIENKIESGEVPIDPEEVSAEQTPEEDKKQSDSVKKKISKRKKTKKKKAEPPSQAGLFGKKPIKDSPPSKEAEEEEEPPQQPSLFEESSLISSELLKRILD